MQLQTEAVLLPQSHTLNCKQCNSILLQICLIDMFLKPMLRSIIMKKQHIDAYKYYVLSNQVTFQQLNINSKSFLYKLPNNIQKNIDNFQGNHLLPYNMLYLKEVTCKKCKHLLGYKIQTVTKDMIGCYDILGRIIINIKSVTIWAHDEDITHMLVEQFQSQIEDEQKNKLFGGHQEFQMKKEGRKSCLKKVQEKQMQKMKMKNLRKSLENEIKQKQDKQLIQQIVSTVDFFTQILQNLQKRVKHTQNVCTVLKNKVQKLVPILRKS